MALGNILFTLLGKVAVETEEAESSLDKVEQAAEETDNKFSALQKTGVALGAAATATGAAIVGLTGKSHELNDGIRRVAASTGEAEGGLRDMVLSLTNAGLPMDEAVQTMERLVQSGISTKEEFENLIPTVDTLADATGVSMVEALDSMDGVLAAVGVPLSEMNEHLDTMTFLSQNTTVGTQELGQTMRKLAPEIKGAGLSFEDIAIALSSLSAEGIRGRGAISKMSGALKDANGDQDAFWKLLGVSNETLATQATRLEQSAGLTQKLADINESSLTIWDTVQNEIDKAALRFGTMLEPLRNVGSAMVGLGPALAGASAGARTFGVAIKFMQASFLPLLAIMAVVTAAIVIWQTNLFGIRDFITDKLVPSILNLNKVVEKVIDIVKPMAALFGAALTGDLQKAHAEFIKLPEPIWGVAQVVFEVGMKIGRTWRNDIQPVIVDFKNAAVDLFETFSKVVKDNWDIITAVFKFGFDYIKTKIEGIVLLVQGLLEVFQGFVKIFKGLMEGDFSLVWEGVKQVVQGALTALEGFIKYSFGNIPGIILGLAQKAASAAGDFAEGMVNSIADWFKRLPDVIVDGVRDGLNAAVDLFNRFIGSLSGREIIPSKDLGPLGSTPGFSLPDLPRVPRLEHGLDWVPYDRFPAFLDRGERVLTADQNAAMTAPPVNVIFEGPVYGMDDFKKVVLELTSQGQKKQLQLSRRGLG